MRLFPLAAGGLAYFSGFQWDIVPVPMASLVVLAALWVAYSDICSDPMPEKTSKRIQVLVAEVEPRLDPVTSEQIMHQIASQQSELDPEMLLSDLLDEDDQRWLREQIEMIVKEEV